MLILPTEKIPAKVENPRFLIFYGKPKTGKTTIAAALENNLIIDLEGGSQFLNALAIQARNVSELGQIRNLILEKNREKGGFFYKYITIDNATRLEEICMSYAVTLYKQTPMGKKYEGDDVRTLPNGSGYMYIRQAVRKVIDMFRELCDTLILIGHTKDKMINKDGEEITEMQLNLVGALADIICGEADAVGYIYRKRNQTIINFDSGDDTTKGARAAHIRCQKIVIAESNEENEITTYWDRIFLPEKN